MNRMLKPPEPTVQLEYAYELDPSADLQENFRIHPYPNAIRCRKVSGSGTMKMKEEELEMVSGIEGRDMGRGERG